MKIDEPKTPYEYASGIEEEGEDGADKKGDELDAQLREYQTQTAAMARKTSELQATVRDAETEVEKVRKEKTQLLRHWTATVVNIAKRDEAIARFNGALGEQALQLKAAGARVAGVKGEVVAAQEEHDRLTGVEQRTEKLCAQRRAQIKTTADLTAEARSDLAKASK